MQTLNKINFNTFIFDPKEHQHHIPTFLKKAAKSHGEPERSEGWFHWKFFRNPFGNTIMVCVTYNEELVGCVAYGFQDFVINGQDVRGVLSYETFVDPDYQGQGIFSRLLNTAEKEVRKQGVQLMLNFPNPKSLPGFLKKGWVQLDTNKYFLKPQWNLKLLLALKDIKKGFVPLASNYEQIKGNAVQDYQQYLKGEVDAKVDGDYLNYRFYTFPHGHYLKVEQNNDLAIARLGQRGKLRELQLLHINMENYNRADFNVLIKGLKNEARGVDLMSCPAGADGTMSKLLKAMGFWAVPNKGNICYKLLDDKISAPMELLELEAINFHTY